MSGPGCPIGAGGLLQQIRNGTPVFVFTEWTLALPNTADANNKNQHSKWCTEQIQLANGPVGMQLRIATVGVGGWANLDTDTKLKVDVSTVLGGKVAGVSISPLPPNTLLTSAKNQTATITKSDLKANSFTVDLHTQPVDIWSACVDEKGTVPAITIQTRLTLIGATHADGTSSGGTVGSSDKTDLQKALGVHFNPVWRQCTTA